MSNVEFTGHIGITLEDSELAYSSFDTPCKKPGEKTNVVYIVLDDVGFAQLECYGSDIHTPNINALANQGLRYNNFHTTAICSATRASLLTGANHHAVGVATVVNHITGYPNSIGHINPEYATIAEILKENGYSTYAVGKWHLDNPDNMYGQGPFDNWPLQKGFDKYYGFLNGYTDQFHPDLVCGNSLVRQPKEPSEGYHLSEDLSDHAICYIHDNIQAYPDKPFFLYLSYGAGHSPHQVPEEYVRHYHGKFDEGWDILREKWFARQKELGVVPANAKLTPRNEYAQEWNSLPEKEKKLFARYMEVYAGFLEHTDAQIGRVIDYLKKTGEFENTVIVLLSDNGASAEGGFKGRFACDRGMMFPSDEDETSLALKHFDDIGGEFSSPHYPLGWACLGDTPLQWYKQWAHAGGVKDPLIISYPKGITDKGAIRTQYHHVSDVTPTILELLGIRKPQDIKGIHQKPMQGTSFYYTFTDGDAPSKKRVQYYEQAGNRGIWKDGWKLVASHLLVDNYEDDEWELYHTDEDFSEADNLAEKYPGKVEELKNTWFIEAAKYGVFPLGTGSNVIRTGRQKKKDEERRIISMKEEHYHYKNLIHPFYTGHIRAFHQRSSVITIQLTHSKEMEGILYATGDRFRGQTLYIKENSLHYVYNFHYAKFDYINSGGLPSGKIKIVVETKIYGDTRKVFLWLNGKKAGGIILERLVQGIEGAFAIKAVFRTCPDPKITAPFEYPGEIESFDISLASYGLLEEAAWNEFFYRD